MQRRIPAMARSGGNTDLIRLACNQSRLLNKNSKKTELSICITDVSVLKLSLPARFLCSL